ncbi:MAG: dTDP-4-dehydrorhamnose reductase [Planctomycetota bacterium]
MAKISMRPIAVTGSSGQLGKAISQLLGADAVMLPRAVLDITQSHEVYEVLARIRPRAVINCAAWTAVDAAEQSAQACFAANAAAVQLLAEACCQLDSMLVQVSSDYVFGAEVGRVTPYCESDKPGPLSVYGASKQAGEEAARCAQRYQIVRTCGLYSALAEGPVRGRNFADTMRVLSRDRDEVRVVADQSCTPSYVPHVASGLLALLETGETGTFHLTNAGSTSWHGFARELFRQANISTQVLPITTAEYCSPVMRPLYSVLDNAKLNALGISLPHWQQGITEYLR